MGAQRHLIGDEGLEELRVVWADGFKNLGLSLNGKSIARFDDPDDLRGGYELILDDSRVLRVEIVDGPQGDRVVIFFDGVELYPWKQDPKNRLRGVLYLILAVGAVELLLGVASRLFGILLLEQYGFSTFSALVGATLLFVGWLVQARSTVGITLSLGVVAFNCGLSIISAAKVGTVSPFLFLVVYGAICVFIARGFSAIERINNPPSRNRVAEVMAEVRNEDDWL